MNKAPIETAIPVSKGLTKFRVLGIIALVLAAAVFAVGLMADLGKKGDGYFADTLKDARAESAKVENFSKAVKNAASAEKRSATAITKIDNAVEAYNDAAASVIELDKAIEVGELDDSELEALTEAVNKLVSASDTARSVLGQAASDLGDALNDIELGTGIVSDILNSKLTNLYIAIADSAYSACEDAQDAITAVSEGVNKVYALAGSDISVSSDIVIVRPEYKDIASCKSAIEALKPSVDSIALYSGTVSEWTSAATEEAQLNSSTKVSMLSRAVIALSDNFIGVIFTSFLLIIIGLVLIFLVNPFKRAWAKTSTFSVFIALILMLVAQTYALGFTQGSVGAWAKFWFDNTFNVLRANTSVGMIALGMTLVIITGGIDLAVGSTLAGVGTILMVMIDTGEHGFLIRFGITGVPAFIIGIVVALAAGALIGELIGVVVTKGRVPPFIVTLGVMNVVRSVAQYFTKSYTPTVPDEFELIANKVLFGQRPMTIIYWIILAVIFYFLMKDTAFGRYVYAVGSNERTTRLSGINTDRVKRIVYMISGFVVAIAAVSQLSRLGGMDVASAGSGYELDSIAAVVVGGTAMSGGRGSIIGTVLGVLIIGIMNNLLILLGVDSFLTDAFKGAIVVIAVLVQRKERA